MTKSAPYLAKELGLENCDRFPLASKVMLKEFYVYDLLSRSQDCRSAMNIVNKYILNSGYMELRKWISNDPVVVNSLSKHDSSLENIYSGDKEQHITLGLQSGHLNQI